MANLNNESNPYQFWDTYNPIHTEFNDNLNRPHQNQAVKLYNNIKNITEVWENIYSDQKIKNQGSTSKTVSDSLELIEKTIELLNGYKTLIYDSTKKEQEDLIRNYHNLIRRSVINPSCSSTYIYF